MRKYVIILAIFLFNLSVFAQNKDELTETPRKTIETHLKYLQDDEYKPELSAKTLNAGNLSEEKREKLVIQLKKVMDARGLYAVINDIPNDKDYIDTITGKNTYTPFKSAPEIYLTKKGNNWLYSKETVNNIPELYSATFPFEITGFKKHIPDSLKTKFLGIRLWKLIGLLTYLILALILYKLISWLIGYFLVRLLMKMLKNNRNIVDKYIDPISNPASVLVVLAITHIFLPILEIPVSVNIYIEYLFKALIPLTITMIAYRVSDIFADFYSALAAKTSTTIDDQLIPLVKKIIKVVIVILGVFYVLSNFGVEITPLLAGASIGGLAFALAAQDTLKNLFGSITIYTDQPFEIGDWIVFDGTEGTVEEIKVRSTRVRTFHNSLISIPNGRLADMKIDNMGRRVFRRFRTTISLTYDTPPDLIEAYVDGLRNIVKEHPATRKDVFEIYLNEYNASSLDILVYIFFEVPDWSKELKARQEFMLESIRLAEELGVRFAFPTNTLHIEEMPGQESLTPKYVNNKSQFMEKVVAFIEQRKSKYKSDWKD